MNDGADMSGVAEALARQRLAAQLEKYRAGRASRADIEELYANAETAAIMPVRAKVQAVPVATTPPPRAVPKSFLAKGGRLDRDNDEVSAWLSGFFSKLACVEETPPIAPWVRQHVMLTTGESKQFPGKYNPDLTPCVSILFDFLESPHFREFIGVKSSQVGMTLAVLAALCHKIKFKPADVAFAINNREEIQRIGQTRLRPMLRGCEAIADRVPNDDDKFHNMTIYLLGLTLYLLGGHSVGAAANKSLDWAVIDECDETPEEMKGGESTIIDLLRDRLKWQPEAKLIAFSKPRNENDIIWPEYLHGSRHKVFLPCPHCSGELPPEAMPDAPPGSRLFLHLPQPLPKGYQVLVKTGLRYDHCRREGSRQWDLKRMKEETYYECRCCGGKIEERHKVWMLAHRLYLPTNTHEGALQDDGVTFREDRDPTEAEETAGHPQPIPGRLSFQVSDLYALGHIPGSAFGDIAVELVSATTMTKQRRFQRSRLGLPVGRNVSDNSRSVDKIRRLAGRFKRGHCSRAPLIVIMGVDVQHYGKKWVKCVFYDDDSCEIVDYGVVFSGYMGLIQEADKPVIVDDWGDTPEEDRTNPVVKVGLIDEGDGQRTKSVLSFCITTGAYRRFYPCKGRGGAQTATMPDLVIKQKKNRHANKALPRYLMNADAFAEELYDERIGMAEENAKLISEGKPPSAGALRLFAHPDYDLCIELTTHCRYTEEDEKDRRNSRKKISRRGRVLKPGDWWKKGGADDFGDAVTMCLAAWYQLKPSFGVGENHEHDEDEKDEGDGEAWDDEEAQY